MIRTAIEGEITWFPGLAASVIPYPIAKGIRVHMRSGALGIEVQGLVGAIPLTNGDTLHLVPKIGQVNFLRLLFKAQGLQKDLERAFDAFVTYSVDNEHSVHSLVARHLLYSIAEIMKRSPKQGRVLRKRQGSFAIGQLDAVETAFRTASWNQQPVVCFVKERTLSIPENRIISEAVFRAMPLLDTKDQDALAWIGEVWLRKFPRSSDVASDLEAVERGFATVRFGGSRDYYRRALMLSHIVLGASGLGFADAATIVGDAVLINTATVFEEYLRSVIGAAYQKQGYSVTKGAASKPSLYTDGSFQLDPDIVIAKDGKIHLILDAKYKHPDAGDHYQLFAYASSHAVHRGVLLAPLFSGDDVLIREYVTPGKIAVFEAYLPMSRLDLTESFLKSGVEKFS